MKKLLKTFLVFISICLNFTPVLAFENENTLGDIKNNLDEYLESQSIDIKEGSEEYYEYLLNQLMFNEDEELVKREDYEEILDYASLYLVEYQNSLTLDENNISVADIELSSDFFNKTVSQASYALKEENDENITTSSVSGYNASSAIEYAHSWAKRYNSSTYKTFSSDCTNFVSQCLVAGDLSQKAPSGTPSSTALETTSYWYHKKINSTFYYSTSFVRATDFFTYWKSKSGYSYYTSRSSCASAMKYGDVVILERASTGAKYHSIIISKGGSSGTYCGHTSARLDYAFSKISDSSNYFYRMKFA